LKNYKDDSKPQKTLDLVHPQAATETGGWPFALVFDDPQLGTLANTGLYKISSDANSLEAPADLIFTWSDGHLQVTKKISLRHSYTGERRDFRDQQRQPRHGRVGVAWRLRRFNGYKSHPGRDGFHFYSEGGKLTTLPHKKLDGPEKWGNVWQGGKEFTGIEDRYFTAAFLPSLTDPTPLQTRYWKVFHKHQGGWERSV